MSEDFFTGLYMSDSSNSKMPQWDSAYLDNQGYNSLNELMRAIILRTVDDFHSGGEFHQEALDYLNDENEENEDYIFSFKFICKHLGLDPEKTRHAIIYAKHKIGTRRRTA